LENVIEYGMSGTPAVKAVEYSYMTPGINCKKITSNTRLSVFSE